MLRKVKQDRGSLEDRKALCAGRGRSIPIHQDGDSAVGIQGVDEPRLLLFIGPDGDMFDVGS